MFRLVSKIQQDETYFELFKNYRSKEKLGQAEKHHQINLGEKKTPGTEILLFTMLITLNFL